MTDSTTAPARRWWILAVIGVAQLMVILDNSIVNIALPSAQIDLGFDDAQRQWVITAYALAFGSLLLLGGRLADLFGRKRAFMTGLVGFAAASILGGLAPNFALLVSARALQGVFGALLAPAALSLLTTTFPSGRDRARAFGVFSALAGSGAAIGLLLGGALTQYVDWRWCMYVNAVFAVVALLGALTFLPAHPVTRRPRLDILGTLTASGGLFCIVFGFASAETDGWGSALVYVFLAAGVVLLAGFVLVQRKVAAPLLPLRVVLDRFRGGSFLTILVLTTGMFGISLFLAYLMQQNFGFSPVVTGVAFLPMVGCIVLASNTVPGVLLPRVGPKPLVAVGLLLGAGALFWLSFLAPGSGYAAHVLGPLMLMGLGMGTAMSTAINTATLGVEASDAGVASAGVNTMQQVGGSVGTALLSSVAGTAAASYAVTTRPVPDAATVALHGYTVAFAVASAVFVGGAIVVGLLVPVGRPHRAAPEPQRPAAPVRELEPAASGPHVAAPAAGTSPGTAPGLPAAPRDGDRAPTHDDGTRPFAAVPAAADATPPHGVADPLELTGRVSDPVGAGSAATLTLIDVTDGAQADLTVADADGRYRLRAPREGDYLVVCHAPGFRPVAERLRVDGDVLGADGVGRVGRDLRMAVRS